MQSGRESPPITERPVARAALAIVLLAVLGGVFLAVRAGRADDGDSPEIIAPPTGEATGEPDDPGLGALDGRSPTLGAPAPDFALRDADGEIVKLSDLRGKVVFVNFWATWCRPCRDELPDIQKLYDEKRDEGLEVLAVNYQDNQEDARAFFDDLGISVPMLLDRSGSVYNQYLLQGLPDSFFIDREGNLAALHYGFMSEEKMRQRLEQAGLPSRARPSRSRPTSRPARHSAHRPARQRLRRRRRLRRSGPLPCLLRPYRCGPPCGRVPRSSSSR